MSDDWEEELAIEQEKEKNELWSRLRKNVPC